jgi:AraC-like DNA-binding protein
LPAQRLVFSSSGAGTGADEVKRCTRWFEECRAKIGGREVTIDRNLPFAVSVEVMALGAVGLGRSTGSTMRLERRWEHVSRDADDRFFLVINRARNASQGQNGPRSMTVMPGSAGLFDFAEPNVHVYPGRYSSLTLHMPRRLTLGAMANAEDVACTVILPGNEALRLLVHYATGLLDDQNLSHPAILAHAGQTLIDLAVLAFGTDRDNAHIACLRGVRAARLDAVLRLIRADYADPEISPAAAAARIGISPRYLHKLLHETGSSFAERIQELRLARAFALLCGECGTARKVSEAAYDAGFSDLSHFNRLFRRKYGLTPTAARGHGASPLR